MFLNALTWWILHGDHTVLDTTLLRAVRTGTDQWLRQCCKVDGVILVETLHCSRDTQATVYYSKKRLLCRKLRTGVRDGLANLLIQRTSFSRTRVGNWILSLLVLHLGVQDTVPKIGRYVRQKDASDPHGREFYSTIEIILKTSLSVALLFLVLSLDLS